MDVKNVVTFAAGVAVGVGGTLLVDFLLNKYYDKLEDEEAEGDDNWKEQVNPGNVVGIPEKPPLDELVGHVKVDSLPTVTEYNNMIKLAEKYLEEQDAKGMDPDGEEVEKGTNESEVEGPQVFNIFTDAELEDVSTLTKEDRVPPMRRGKVVTVPHDIMEISQEQFLTDVLDYDKKTCTWFANDKILAGCDDDLDIMDVDTTVGREIIGRFEADDGLDVLFVSNMSTETDYEILQTFESYDVNLENLNQS